MQPSPALINAIDLYNKYHLTATRSDIDAMLSMAGGSTLYDEDGAAQFVADRNATAKSAEINQIDDSAARGRAIGQTTAASEAFAEAAKPKRTRKK